LQVSTQSAVIANHLQVVCDFTIGADQELRTLVHVTRYSLEHRLNVGVAVCREQQTLNGVQYSTGDIVPTVTGTNGIQRTTGQIQQVVAIGRTHHDAQGTFHITELSDSVTVTNNFLQLSNIVQ